MNDHSLEDLTVLILSESMRLLQLSNRKASLAQMREVCTAGPESALLKTCLAYVEQEWPGETQAAGVFRDFHALPSGELAAVQARVIACCQSFSVSSMQGWPEDFDEDPGWESDEIG